MPFVDVLRYLKDGGTDMYFRGPYELKCKPCVVPYDYIGKEETFYHDTYYIIDNKLPEKRGKNTYRNMWATVENMKSKFHKELKEYEGFTAILIGYLRQKYARDFEQFGYATDGRCGRIYATCTGYCC